MPICNCLTAARVIALSLLATWYCRVHGHCGATLTEWVTQGCPGCGASVFYSTGRHSSRIGLVSNEPCSTCVPQGIGL
jgi:hypothetical protein